MESNHFTATQAMKKTFSTSLGFEQEANVDINGAMFVFGTCASLAASLGELSVIEKEIARISQMFRIIVVGRCQALCKKELHLYPRGFMYLIITHLLLTMRYLPTHQTESLLPLECIN